MRKRIHSMYLIALLLTLSLLGCNKNADQYGYAPVFKELSWGMTKEEVINTLGLTNSNARVVEQEENSAYIIIQMNSQISLFNEIAIPHLLITKGEKSEQSSIGYPVNALSAIILQYNDIDSENLTKSMNKILGKPTSMTENENTKTYVWKSKEKFGELDSKVREKVVLYIDSLGSLTNVQEAQSQDSKVYPRKNSAINKITVTISDETNARVTYYGDWAVYVHCSNLNSAIEVSE